MKQYPKYKESGIQWLGKVPIDWERIPLQYALRNKITDGPHETPQLVNDGIPFISVDSLNSTENIDFTVVKKFISEEDFLEYSKKAVLEEKDILFSKSATIGKTAIVGKEKFMVWSPLAIIKPDHNKTCYKYLYYVLSNNKYQEHVCLLATFSTQLNVGMRSLESSMIPFPPLSEQQAIANYLDKKTGKIDESIHALETQKIDLHKYRKALITETVTRGVNPNAKLKDSGIQWIGMIPEEWKVVPLKTLLHLLTDGTHQTPTYIESGIPFISIKDMSKGFIDFSDTKFISEEEHQTLSQHAPVEKGDIIFSRIGTLGVFIKVNTDIVFDIFVSLGLMKIIPNSIDTDFLVYYLSSGNVLQYINQVKAGEGTSAAKFNLGDVKETKILLPPLSEQQAIADYLNEKTAKIDEAIAKIDTQISDLQAYRSALITEAVTGKIDVRRIE